MERKIAGLFDLDGVILDTEDFYSQFWGEQGRLYCPEIPDFTAKVKGRTLSDLLTTYFPGKSRRKRLSGNSGILSGKCLSGLLPERTDLFGI